MLYEGQNEIGLKVIRAIRGRYDGNKRSPFNEIEYGHHYARAMVSWGGILALTGFQYSAVEKSIQFNNLPGEYFWSNGYQCGKIEIGDNGDTRIEVFNGNLYFIELTLKGRGVYRSKKGIYIKQGESRTITVSANDSQAGKLK